MKFILYIDDAGDIIKVLIEVYGTMYNLRFNEESCLSL